MQKLLLYIPIFLFFILYLFFRITSRKISTKDYLLFILSTSLIYFTFHKIDFNSFFYTNYKNSDLLFDINKETKDNSNYLILENTNNNILVFNNDFDVIYDLNKDFKFEKEYKFYLTSESDKDNYKYFDKSSQRIGIILSILTDRFKDYKISKENKLTILKMLGIRFFIKDLKADTTFEFEKAFKLIKSYENTNVKLLAFSNYESNIKFRNKATLLNYDSQILNNITYFNENNLDSNMIIIKNNHKFRKQVSILERNTNESNIKDKFELLEKTKDSIKLKVFNNKPNYLIISDIISNNWEVTNNNKKSNFIDINYFQKAIILNSGENNIEIYKKGIFESLSSKIEIFILLLFVILLLFEFTIKEEQKAIFVSNKKLFIIFFVSFIITLTMFMPTFISFLYTPEDFSFVGFETLLKNGNKIEDADLFTYIAKMRQGLDGNLLYENRYTLEPSYKTLLFIFYTLLGNLAYILNLDLFSMYFISLYIIDFLLCLVLFKFISLFFKDLKWQAFGVILLSLSTGYSLIFKNFTNSNFLFADTLYNEFNLLNTMLNIAHFSFSLILMLICFYFIQPNKISLKNYIILTIVIILLALIHPFDFITVSSICFFYSLLDLFYLNKKELEKTKHILFKLTPFLFGSIPIFYINYVLNNNEVLKLSLKATNVLLSPKFYVYIGGFGTAFILLLLSIYYLVKKKIPLDAKILLLLTWIVVNFILLYSPFPFQRRFMMGIQIPIVILGLIGLKKFFEEKNKVLKQITLILVILTMLLPSYKILDSKYKLGFLYINSDITALMDWINKNNIKDKNFFSYYELGLYLPVYTSNKVLLGHWSETINFDVRAKLVEGFFSVDSEKQKTFLTNIGIDYLVLGPEEKKLGKLNFSENLTKIYSIGEYDLYKLDR